MKRTPSKTERRVACSASMRSAAILRQCSALVLLLAAAGCSEQIHFRKPAYPASRDPEDQLDQVQLDGPAGIYALTSIPASIDSKLSSRQEHVEQDLHKLDVFVGEAIGYAFRNDPAARVSLTCNDSRFETEVHAGDLFDANSEITYTMYAMVSIDAGAVQSVVATGRVASMTFKESVRRAVATCVRDLHARIANLLQVEDHKAAGARTARAN